MTPPSSRRLAGLFAAVAVFAALFAVPAEAAPAAPDATQPVSITLATIGSKDKDQQRTQQGYTFENAEWTGLYIRPGVKARFTIDVTSSAADPNVVWAYREAGRVDDRGYAAMRADDGGRLKNGVNEVTFDTSKRTVGQTLLIRNDTTDPGSVMITNRDADDGRPSLGAYPVYTHDPAHPERFWSFVQSLRAYVASGVDGDAGNMTDHPDLHMDAAALILGRQVYELRASKLADSLKGVASQADATAWIGNTYTVATDRLAFLDRLQGFDETDTDARQKPSRMKVVLEMTSNLTSPSTMFAWFTAYHLPESVWPGVATTMDGAHGWANDHELGHMMDVNPLIRGEETNNQYALWGRRLAGITAKTPDKPFTTGTYHGNAVTAQNTITQWLDQRLKDPDTASKWGDIWLDVVARFTVLHWFDEYDYASYDYARSPYKRELARQVETYGGFGAVLRQVRRDPARYRNVGTVYDSAARAYSDALGYDMSEVMNRYGMPVTTATADYTARYPKLTQQVQYFTLDADAMAINGAKPFATGATPSVTTTRNPDGTLHITATLKDAVGYELHADGKPVAYSTSGAFDVKTGDHDPAWTVVAYDVRANQSTPMPVRSTTTVAVDVKAADDRDVSRATVTLTPDDDTIPPVTVHPNKSGRATLSGVPSGGVTVTLDGATTIPAKRVLDGYDQSPAALRFTLVPEDVKATATPRPGITGVSLEDGSLGFTIRPASAADDVMFTTDGSEPTPTHGTRWTGEPVRIMSSPLTVRAVAFRAGYAPSPVAAATFTDDRTVDLYDEIYGPDYHVGHRVTLGVGEYRDAGQLGEVFEDLRSLNVPAGLKVTGYEGANLDGKSHEWTGKVNWVNGYDALPIRSLRVETVGAPKAKKTGTVTFRPGAKDATGSMPDLDLYDNIPAAIPDVAYTRKGWTATGWTDDKGNTIQPGSTVTASATLTAVWRRNTYTIAFDPAGGDTTPTPLHVDTGANVTLPEAGTRRGHTQTGWRLPDGTIVKPGATVTALTDRDGATITLVAVWKANTITIRFKPGVDDAAGSTPDVTATTGDRVTLPANGFTRTGYTFTGWQTVDGSTHKPGDMIDAPDADITLTAVWRANTYVIRFRPGADDATGAMADLTASYDVDVPLPANTFARDGYAFDGWALPDGRIADDGATVRNLTATDKTTVTLTARWTTTPDHGNNGGNPDKPDTKPGQPGQTPTNPDNGTDGTSGGQSPSDGGIHDTKTVTDAANGDRTPTSPVLARTGVAATGLIAMITLVMAGVALTRLARRGRK